MKKVFLIGSMIGLPGLNKKTFEYVEQMFRDHKINVISPMNVGTELSTELFVRACTLEMTYCDHAVLLDDRLSGCAIANPLYQVAKAMGLTLNSINEFIDPQGNWIYKPIQEVTDLEGAEG